MESLGFFEIEQWEQEHIQKLLPNENILFTSKKAHEEQNQDILQASAISTFIYSELTKETLGKFPNLKLIATRSTGYDHIDLDFCKEKNITVANVPSYGSHAVAEHTFALILAITRKIIPTVDRTRRANFSLEGLRGMDLAGKKLGVIGAGKIGKKVIKLALAFEMNVLVHTRHPIDIMPHENLKTASLEELLSNSDIVTLHVPYSTQTHHLINRENIKLFKKGSILINTARGPLIETQAILEALESGILKHVGLDVLEEECSLKEEREQLTKDFLEKCDIKTQLLDHVLLSRDDVIFTSHNGFNSDDAVRQILDTTAANINSFSKGNPQNTV